MHYYVLTLFPEMITNACGESILGRASQKGLISVEAINIRDYSTNKHNRVDDYPYGGGAGMVMQPMPVYDAWKDLTERIGKKPRVLFMTPQGKPFSQKLAEEYAKEEDLIFLCGHYEGIDQRVLDLIVTDEVSAGDFVLTGGELPAMMMIDCISRLVPGVLNNEASAQDESFEGICWSIHNIQDQKFSWASQFRLYFYQVIMAILISGDVSSQFFGQQKNAQISLRMLSLHKKRRIGFGNS